jgi:hypothetical protein
LEGLKEYAFVQDGSGNWKKPRELCDREDYILSHLHTTSNATLCEDKFPHPKFWTDEWRRRLKKLIQTNTMPEDGAFKAYCAKLLSNDPTIKRDLQEIHKFFEWMTFHGHDLQTHLGDYSIIPARLYTLVEKYDKVHMTNNSYF